MTEFEATVRKQKSAMGLFGKITSKHLAKHINKKVNIKVEEDSKWLLIWVHLF